MAYAALLEQTKRKPEKEWGEHNEKALIWNIGYKLYYFDILGN